MSLHEIILPETKPETEWVRGRALQKTGGTYSHSTIRMGIAIPLRAWALEGGHGRVAPSWRFRIAPRVGLIRPLAPDVAYLSYDALPADAPWEAVQTPLGAPTVAVDIISDDDLSADVEDKIVTYLAANCSAFIAVNLQQRVIVVHDSRGGHFLRPGDSLTHHILPGFELDITRLFARAHR